MIKASEEEGANEVWLGRERRTVVWSVAGFDPSSGAGVTADLMTFAAHGLFGCSAVTALTAQSTLGVFASSPVAPDLLQAMLARLREDLPPAGVKIGMLGSKTAVEVVAAELDTLAETVIRVLDPVLRSSSGHVLFPAEELSVFREQLLPRVDWVTPNWAELRLLSGCAVGNADEAWTAARTLQQQHPRLHVVVTGGDVVGAPTDWLVLPGGERFALSAERVETSSTHGTGCAFSSALLALLVRGLRPRKAVAGAKAYVAEALRHAPGLGGGKGPMELLWPLQGAALLP